MTENVFYLFVDTEGNEHLSEDEPKKTEELLDGVHTIDERIKERVDLYRQYIKKRHITEWYTGKMDSDYGVFGEELLTEWINLPDGTIKSGLGRQITYEESPVKVKMVPTVSGIEFAEI